MTDKEILAAAILRDQVVPALGCTEPGAVALCTAAAKELLGAPVETLRVRIDRNVLKNGTGVGIPGTQERGNALAAALALVIGRSEYGLEVLKDVTPDAIDTAKQLLADGAVTVELDSEADGLSVEAIVTGGGHSAAARIQKTHTNFVYKERDGVPVFVADLPDRSSAAAVSLRDRIREYSVTELIRLSRGIPSEELSFIRDGIDMNLRIAEEGLKLSGVGSLLYRGGNCSLSDKARAYTCAASDARMSGVPLPVMSSAGSGNHGLATVIPISIFGESLGRSEEDIRRAVALSHLVCIYVKSYLGALSPVCGCGVAAGVGCAAGLTALRDGSEAQIASAIINMISGISGMLCDGAKKTCSVKLAVAVAAAIDASDMALSCLTMPGDVGILADAPEDAIRNLARVSREGMDKADDVMVDILTHRG